MSEFKSVVGEGRQRRLAFYDDAATGSYWDDKWTGQLSEKTYEKSLRGDLGDFEKPFVRWLPREGKILEAGCGMARHVAALRARGYDCEGMECAGRTVEAIRKVLPDLPVREGDVTRLDVPDAHYAGYISLGVVEHSQEGPEPFLREAYRVLASGGTAYISVPYFHALRRFKAGAGFYPRGGKGTFFQYAFTVEEMTDLLREHGFEVKELHGYGSWKGLKDEIPLLQWIYRTPKVGGAYRIATHFLPGCDRAFGHMIGFICRK